MVVKQLSSKATKVEIFDDEDNILRSYYVGGPTQNFQGTHMLLIQNGVIADRAFVTHIPGFDGYLTVRYFLNEEKWRDRKIFGYVPSDIDYVKVTYLKKPDSSFIIENTGADSFGLHAPIGSKSIPPHAVDMDRINRYLSYYSNIYCEAFQNVHHKKDSILSTPPFCEIAVKPFTDNENVVKIYHMAIGQRSKSRYDAVGQLRLYDRDRYYASINEGGDFVVIQDYTFGKLMRNYPDFLGVTKADIKEDISRR